MIFFDILIILLLYASFGAVHSLLAALSIKERTARRYPRFMPYYRLSYNIFALFHFYWVYELTPFIDVRVYDLPNPFDILILVPQFISLLGILWTLGYMNGSEFLGLAQIARRSAYRVESLDEESALIASGPYKWSRHPLYLFCIGVVVFRPYMFLDYVVSVLCIISYFYIGAYYEEKRLQKIFGEAYRRYIASTPMIIPFLTRR